MICLVLPYFCDGFFNQIIPRRACKRPRVKRLRIPTAFFTKKGRERHLPVAHGPLARSVAAYQLWSLRKLGAVWLRANTPSGPTLRFRARKLSVVLSFVVAIAMLQSTFLVLTGRTKVASAVLLLHSPQAYHDSGGLVKQRSLRL